MKRKGHISQTYVKRDYEVLPELFRRAKRQATYPTSTDKIFRIMATLPTDRYYICDDAALLYVRQRMLQGKEPTFRTKEKQRLYDALYQEVTAMMKEEKYASMGIAGTVICALMRPAPCVGLSPEGIGVVFHRKLRKRRHEKV